MPGPGAAPVRQRGWAGVLMLLLAVLLVALLAGSLLKQFGVPGPSGAQALPDARDTGARRPGIGAAPLEPEGGLPASGNAIQRARAVEESLMRQAADLDQRIDDAAK